MLHSFGGGGGRRKGGLGFRKTEVLKHKDDSWGIRTPLFRDTELLIAFYSSGRV